jgi:hypothetical protein
LVTAFTANVTLAAHPIFRATLAGQIAFYAAAALGLAMRSRRLRVLSLPAGFVFLNVMAVRGFIYFLIHRDRSGWR